MLGCAVGDALGRPFEMMSATDPRLRARWESLSNGSTPLPTSDDAAMMLAIAESLVRTEGVCPRDILAALARGYDPARGYGHGMTRALDARRRRTGPPAAATWPEGSKGSGGAVRSVAIACAYHDDPVGLAPRAEDAAATTHAHPIGRAGAIVHAAAIARIVASPSIDGAELLHRIQYALTSPTPFDQPLRVLSDLLANHADTSTAVRTLGNGLFADQTVPLALLLFLRWAPHFPTVIEQAVLAGGDTDTIAAMAGALCGALVGEAGIPVDWLDRTDAVPRARSLADATFDFYLRRVG